MCHNFRSANFTAFVFPLRFSPTIMMHVFISKQQPATKSFMSAWIWCRRRRTRRWREKLLSFLWNFKTALQVRDRFMIHLKQFGKGIDTWMSGLCQHNFNSPYFCRLSVFFLPGSNFVDTATMTRSRVFPHNYPNTRSEGNKLSHNFWLPSSSSFNYSHPHIRTEALVFRSYLPWCEFFPAIEINQLCDIINFPSPFYSHTHTHTKRFFVSDAFERFDGGFKISPTIKEFHSMWTVGGLI